MHDDCKNLYFERETYSKTRLNALRTKFKQPDFVDIPELTAFAAGSYARNEASEHSDLDVFFLRDGSPESLENPRTKELKLFGKLIETIRLEGFQEFSNDCQYLVVHHVEEMFAHLGTSRDDHDNFFTCRMLLLLESACLYGDNVYDQVIAKLVNSYFVDYPDHKLTFRPIFLLNDICRFWKTMLLNYESRRGHQIKRAGETDEDFEKRRIKHKVKNFKLKFSRMTTCFATIAALGSCETPADEDQVIALTKLTPRERLQGIPGKLPVAAGAIDALLEEYAWFLEQTGKPTGELEEPFIDKEHRKMMFDRANAYGDRMYNLLEIIDQAPQTEQKFLRYLVI